jgi:glycosyltransferase involved in cell wall biosynthesis
MRAEPLLTVLMATYNGAATLPRVLEAYDRLEPPHGGWRLVIVDNGSTDQTREVISAFTDRLPLSYLLCPKKGQNAARNAGLSAVSGNLVVCSDDDALPEKNWLVKLREAADAHPSFTVFGGTILPEWEVPPEEWLPKWVPLGPAYSLTQPAMEEGPVSPGLVFSPNMAIRSAVFREGYRFDEQIGPQGSSYPMGSETEFIKRLARNRFECWHCKDAVVRHIVRSHQMTKNWVLRRAVRFGRGQYRIQSAEAKGQPASVAGVPRYLVRQIAAQAWRAFSMKLSRDGEGLFKERWELNYLVGMAIEARMLFRQR